MRHYLTIIGSRGQCSILQARRVPNQFTVEHQTRGHVMRTEVFTSWRAYALAYSLAHGSAGSNKFAAARFEALGY
jgi:hypothetical protein